MIPSKNALDLACKFEGFSANPYLCPAGKPTIGYGTTQGVTMDMAPITRLRAEELLIETMTLIGRRMTMYINVPLNQNQFDALCSLVYNAGTAPVLGTLGNKLNAGDVAGAAEQFDRWVYANKKILSGLVKRRAAEKALFLTPA